MTNKIDDILTERRKTHGDFKRHAFIAQNFKECLNDVINNFDPYDDVCTFHREALEMIMHKIARILAGNPNHIDHWVDIAGYAQCVVNILEGHKKSEK